jgi:hypothetical protein
MNKKIAIAITCPGCNEQIQVSIDKGSVTIGTSDSVSKRSDRPDGGVRGESQQEYFGIK